MQRVYDTKKDLPCEALHDLFMAVGWSDGTVTLHKKITHL